MGLISEETIQRVGEAVDIVDLIGSYFPLKRAGTSFRALCPFHREKSPSFHVNPARQNYHCFGCGAGGGTIRFVMEYEHLDFPTAVRRLAQRAGIPIVEDASSPDDHRNHSLRQRLLALHAEASAWLHHQLLKSPEGAEARDYLKSRGLNSVIAKSWQLGYAPSSWDALLSHLGDRKFSREEILQSGLASSKDEQPGSKSAIYSRFRDRVMFPIRNDYGEVIAFSGRILGSDLKAAKYVNSPETPLFSKGRVLFGLDKTKRDLIDKNAAIVCEGQIDLISSYEAGIRNVIAPQGTAFTGEQARLLKRYVESVLLCFDSDPAGRKAATRSLPALLSQGLMVKIVTLPQGEDPDSLIRHSGAQAFAEVVDKASDFFEHSVDEAIASGELNDSAGKSRLIARIAPPLALVQDAVLKETLLGRISSRLGLPQGAIRVAMKAPTVDQGENEPSAPEEDVLTLSAGMEMLCRLALTSKEVREWLRGQPSLDNLEAGGRLVQKLSAADFEDGTPLPPLLLAQFSAPEERLVSAMDINRPAQEPLDRAKQIFQGIQVQNLVREIDGLKSQIADPALPTAERQKIQKQILDLTIRVADVRRPFPQA